MPRYSLSSYYFKKYYLGLIELVGPMGFSPLRHYFFNKYIFLSISLLSFCNTICKSTILPDIFPQVTVWLEFQWLSVSLESVFSSLLSGSCPHMHSLILSEWLMEPLGTALELLLCKLPPLQYSGLQTPAALKPSLSPQFSKTTSLYLHYGLESAFRQKVMWRSPWNFPSLRDNYPDCL